MSRTDVSGSLPTQLGDLGGLEELYSLFLFSSSFFFCFVFFVREHNAFVVFFLFQKGVSMPSEPP